MRDLVESILTGDNVEASKLFESHMDTILEKKIYEIKRSIQISEVVTPVKGKPGQFKGQNTPADWAKYRKQHPSFGMHDVPTKEGKPKKQKAPEHEKTASGGLTKAGIEARKKRGYVKAYPAVKAKEFIDKVIHYHKTGEITEQHVPFVRSAVSGGKKAVELGAAPKEPPRSPDAMKSSKDKDDKESLKTAAWRDLSKKRKGLDVSPTDAAQSRLQKAKDRLVGRSLKGALKGRNIAKNIATVAKHATQTSAAKSIKGGHDVWMGKKEPTTLKGKGIALVRDIFAGE